MDGWTDGLTDAFAGLGIQTIALSAKQELYP